MKNIRREDWESLKPTVQNWGIVDVENATLLFYPYYRDWSSILYRVFNGKVHQGQPTYVGSTIDPDWKYLSNYIKFVDSQPNRDWINCVPDKDFLSTTNKHYGVETVVYISPELNSFITDRRNYRGEFMLGVSAVKDSTKSPYRARCGNILTNKREHLGVFSTELEAHKAWQAKKHEVSLKLAELQDDPRVAKVLRERYAPDKDWSDK